MSESGGGWVTQMSEYWGGRVTQMSESGGDWVTQMSEYWGGWVTLEEGGSLSGLVKSAKR